MFKVGTGEPEVENKFLYVWKKQNEEQKAIKIET